MPTRPKTADLVRANYDQRAALYACRKRMQTRSLEKLLALLAAGEVPVRGRLLDVGCGDGAAFAHLAALVPPFSGQYVGLDLSSELISRAGRAHFGAEFLVGDAEHLQFDSSSFDAVISNSVLHWLNSPDAPTKLDASLGEVFRVLRPGGWFLASVAGTGTARRFLDAYQSVLMRLRDDGRLDEFTYRRDPIGSMDLHSMVERLGRYGFEVAHARMDYEPVDYATSTEYQEDARAYGFEMFMAPVAAGEREAAWAAVGDAFRTTVGHGPYLHDQYMIYVYATKPG